MKHNTSKLTGDLIFVTGLVTTIVGYYIGDHPSKMGFALAGLLITFFGKYIKEYGLFD